MMKNLTEGDRRDLEPCTMVENLGSFQMRDAAFEVILGPLREAPKEYKAKGVSED